MCLLSPLQQSHLFKTWDDQHTRHRFYVRSLGSASISEDELTNGQSSRTVNRCISELARGLDDSVSRWGGGKDLYMDINQTDILLIDPSEMTIVHKQAIPAIRIWGVGRENSRFDERIQASKSILRAISI